MQIPQANIDAAIERVDKLLSSIEPSQADKLRMGLGVRLALGMAREISQGEPLGSRTAALVADWNARYEAALVESAIAMAREFLTRPAELQESLGKKMQEESPDLYETLRNLENN